MTYIFLSMKNDSRSIFSTNILRTNTEVWVKIALIINAFEYISFFKRKLMFRKQVVQLNIQFEKTEEASRSSFLQTG